METQSFLLAGAQEMEKYLTDGKLECQEDIFSERCSQSLHDMQVYTVSGSKTYL